MQKTENTENYVKKVDIWPDLLEFVVAMAITFTPTPLLYVRGLNPIACQKHVTDVGLSQKLARECLLVVF